MCARFQAAPKESHHKAVKHILRYLAHTPTLGLRYPKGSIFWIFWCWLCWRQGWSQVYIRHMSFSWSITCLLAFEEAELCITLNCWIWIHCCWILLCSASMDEENSQGLWHQHEECATLLRQWKHHQAFQESSSALEDKAHRDLSSLSQRSCQQGRHWYHSRQHWRATGRYLH